MATYLLTTGNDIETGTADADTFDGIINGKNGGTDLLNGGAGGDTFLIGGDGAGTIDGGADIDRLVLYGDFGNRTFSNIEIAEINADYHAACTIDQIYSFESITSAREAFIPIYISIVGSGGFVDFSLLIETPHAIDAIAYYADSAVSIAGTDYNDTLSGSNFSDTLWGGGGTDWMYAGVGSDVLYGESGDDLMTAFYQAEGKDTFYGGEGNDYFDILNNNRNSLFGDEGDDFFSMSGSATNGSINGGDGIDEVTIFHLGDVAFENVEILNVDFTNLKARIDQLAAFDTIRSVYVAQKLVLTLTGSGGTLDFDALHKGMPVELFGGAVTSGLVVTATNNDDIVEASKFADTIVGAGGNDRLSGGAGSDLILGGTGNDTYVVDSIGDIVDERGGTSVDFDTILSSISLSLLDTVRYKGKIEAVELQGSAAVNVTGNGLNNLLVGNSAANVIDGGLGADTMRGLGGNDTYVVDSAGDVVDESVGGSSGTDTILSSISLSLLDSARYKGHIEAVELQGSAAINVTGNGLANVLTGNSGNNTLNGLSGADTMRGLGGNDLYGVHDVADVVDESVAGSGGTDTINSLVNTSLVTVAGAAIGKGYVENIVLLGSANAFAYGNSLANVLTGNAGSNVLAAGLGNDTLTGGGGNDFFLFNTAPNATANVDTITDMNAASDDTIRLENAIFTALTKTGTLAATAFRIATGAKEAEDRIIYDSASGDLFYDSDGNGAGGSVKIAVLDAGLALTHLDFVVI